jgi:hypothetical protein
MQKQVWATVLLLELVMGAAGVQTPQQNQQGLAPFSL